MSETTPPAGEEQFITLITQHQAALTGYLASLLPDRAAADEVLQETNLVLWKKRDEFAPGTNFKAWAFRTGHFQALAYLKREKRRKTLTFGDDVLEKLAAEAADHFEGHDARLAALKNCLGKLPDEDRTLIQSHYFERLSMEEHARRAGRSLGALRQVLYRIRGALRDCISRTLAAQNAGA